MIESDQGTLLKPTRWMVTREFRQVINGATVAYKPGHIIEDEELIRQVTSVGAPVVEILDEDDLWTCPHCGKASSRTMQQSARELLMRAKTIMPGMR